MPVEKVAIEYAATIEEPLFRLPQFAFSHVFHKVPAEVWTFESGE